MRCSGVLAVLATLLSASVARADESLPALRVEARFGCAPRQARPLVLIQDVRARVEVPAGCPDAGTSLLLALHCRGPRCEGSAFLGRQVVAFLQGPRQRVRPAHLHDSAPRALKLLQVRVLGDTRVAVDESLAHHRPVEVWATAADQRRALRLKSGGAGLAELPRAGGGWVRLAFQVDRDKKEAVHLRVLREDGRLLLDEEVRLGGVRELACARVGLACEGHLLLGVRPLAEGPAQASGALP